MMLRIQRYKNVRHWALYDGSELVVVTVYLRGAQEVQRRLEARPLEAAEAAAQAAAVEAAARPARAAAQAARARAGEGAPPRPPGAPPTPGRPP